MFSLGCVLYYALTSGGHPYGKSVERELNILNARYNMTLLHETLHAVNPGLVAEAQDLITAMVRIYCEWIQSILI